VGAGKPKGCPGVSPEKAGGFCQIHWLYEAMASDAAVLGSDWQARGHCGGDPSSGGHAAQRQPVVTLCSVRSDCFTPPCGTRPDSTECTMTPHPRSEKGHNGCMGEQASIATILEIPGPRSRDSWVSRHARRALSMISNLLAQTNSAPLQRDLSTAHALAIRLLRPTMGRARGLGKHMAADAQERCPERGQWIHAVDDFTAAPLSRDDREP
jgi:hypothetical protein